MAVTLASLSTRIRLHIPQNEIDEADNPVISVTPSTLCTGIVALNHDRDNVPNSEKRSCSKIRRLEEFQEIHRLTEDIILDHCWTTLPDWNTKRKECTQTDENFRSVLVLLTKHNSHHKINSPGIESGSVLCIQIYSMLFDKHHDTKNEKDNPNLSLVCTIKLNFNASSISVSKDIIAIASSTGILICNIIDFIQSGKNLLDEIMKMYYTVKIMRSCVIHAMFLAFPYLVAASGDRVSLWRVDNIMACREMKHIETRFEAAIWTTKLHHYQGTDKIRSLNSRVTCIQLSGDDGDSFRLIALSCWDGSAFVFRNRAGDETWERLTKRVISSTSTADNMSPPWEEDVISGHERAFPTILALHSAKNASQLRNFMAVSYPGSNNVRCYDLDLGLRYDNFSIQGRIKCTCQVQGMITLKSAAHSTESRLIWIDEDDTIYEHFWPQCGITTSPSLTHCKNDRIHLASWHEGTSLIFEAWLKFDEEENTWTIQYDWPQMNLDKGKSFKSSTPLDFLDDRDVFNLILMSNIEKNAELFQCDRHMQMTESEGARLVFNADLFGIFIPADSVLFVFGREEKGWMTIDTRSQPLEACGIIGELFTHID